MVLYVLLIVVDGIGGGRGLRADSVIEGFWLVAAIESASIVIITWVRSGWCLDKEIRTKTK